MAVDSFPIEAGMIKAFAAAIGDENPAYQGPTALAPPTFVQASAHFDPDYPLRPKPGQPWWGSGGTATGTPGGGGLGSGRSLHAEQHFEYVRALRVGDVLRAVVRPGDTWEKVGRSGRLVFRETITDFIDETEELVVRARSVSVMTEPLDDPSAEAPGATS